MHDMKKFLQLVKQAAVEAIRAQKPCDVMYATVQSIEPVSIRIENSVNIPEEMLILTRNVKSQIAVNDSVAVIRKQGGQKYFIAGVIA